VTASKPELLVGLHVRIPKALLDKIVARRDVMRKASPMTNLSDAVRAVLEDGLKRSAR